VRSDLETGKSRLAVVIATVIAIIVCMAAVPTQAADTSCCFNNARYSGTCNVAPGKDETCASILSYLNKPSSVGRSYCGGTDIRGGWRAVGCTTAKASGKTGSAGGTSNNQSAKPVQP